MIADTSHKLTLDSALWTRRMAGHATVAGMLIREHICTLVVICNTVAPWLSQTIEVSLSLTIFNPARQEIWAQLETYVHEYHPVEKKQA